MHTENSIVMNAPLRKIFSTAADLSVWPSILPHYRYVLYLERRKSCNVVRMAARRGMIPVRWTAEQEVDTERMEVRFRHLSALTRGMLVVWTFRPLERGILVRIRHDLTPRLPLIGRFFAEKIIGKLFVSSIATRTLYHMKLWVESEDE